MVPASRLSEQQLRDLADTAFQTLNWAKRVGFKREQQLDEAVKAFEITLGYRAPKTVPETFNCPIWPSCGCPDGAVDAKCPGLKQVRL